MNNETFKRPTLVRATSKKASNYITVGKLYPVLHNPPEFISDERSGWIESEGIDYPIFCFWEGCSHLDGDAWEIVEWEIDNLPNTLLVNRLREVLKDSVVIDQVLNIIDNTCMICQDGDRADCNCWRDD